MTFTPLRWREYQPPPPAHGFLATLRQHYDFSDYSIAFEEAADQLRLRQPPSDAVWGEDPLRLHVAQVLKALLKDRYEWPNDHFIPDDPVDIALMMPWDQDESREVALHFDEQFNLRTYYDEVDHYGGGTLGDLVEYIVGTIRKSQPNATR